jgi:inhibitor of KinA
MEIVPLGDSAFIVRVDDSLGKVLAAARKLEEAGLPGVVEVAPAFASVAVFLESPERLEDAEEASRIVLRQRRRFAKAEPRRRLIEVPVCYEHDFAPDLEAVAQNCGCTIDDVVRRHAGARYHVRCLGFSPGFPYLSGLPAKLATPRRPTPRTSVPAGSVGIGGAQTGIYPFRSPGGWNIIGRTPLRLFDATREPAVLLRPGDKVRFVRIEREEFERWES